MEHDADEPPSGDGEPALVEGDEKTTYPSWGMGKSSPPGTRHSSASVRIGSIPVTMSLSRCVGVTVERCQFDMVMAEIDD